MISCAQHLRRVLANSLSDASRQDPGFAVLSEGPGWTGLSKDLAAEKMLVIVHPGDVIEHPHGWSDAAQAKAVVAFSLLNQAAIARHINERSPDTLTVVLHRESSDQFRGAALPPWIDPGYADAVAAASVWGANLYGDDLDQAAEWLVRSGQISSNTEVFMTGAYSDAEHGCITHLGQTLLGAVAGLEVEVDSASPTDASNSALRWNGSSMHGLALRSPKGP